MKSVGFVQAAGLFFSRYFDFGGRSRRSEFWWAILFTSIVGSIIGAIVPDFAWIWTLIILIPSLSLEFRRLHDVGKSAWWLLWNFLPVVGQIIVLVLFLKDSTADNKWGPNPKR